MMLTEKSKIKTNVYYVILFMFRKLKEKRIYNAYVYIII